MDYLLLILGFVALIFGGEFLVKGAVGMALKAQIPTLVIGMTVVSFGTSAPELLVSLQAALVGGEEAKMSLGNVIGSNIANIALVLGITAIIYPIPVHRDSLRQDWSVMMFSTMLFLSFMLDLKIVRWEGIVLFVLIVVFTYFLIWKSRKSKKIKSDLEQTPSEDDEIIENAGRPAWLNILFIVIGCVGLVFGAKWLLGAATNIALGFGVSPFIISVTVLAFGTSVPELVTSAIAAYRKQTDIAIGNLIGSNIFNILCVVGLTATVAEMPLDKSVLGFDALWMVGIALGLLPMMIGRKIHRWKGFVLVGAYFLYIFFLVKGAA